MEMNLDMKIRRFCRQRLIMPENAGTGNVEIFTLVNLRAILPNASLLGLICQGFSS